MENKTIDAAEVAAEEIAARAFTDNADGRHNAAIIRKHCGEPNENEAVKVELTEKDFKDLRSFEQAMKKQLGDSAYIGTDSAVVVVEYPKALKDALRPGKITPMKFVLVTQLCASETIRVSNKKLANPWLTLKAI